METTSKLKVSGVAFTGYPVTDIARARAFYENVLNLKLTADNEHEGRHWVEYDIGATTLAISNMSEDRWKPTSDGPSIALEMEDFPAAVAALRAAGATFSLEPFDATVCWIGVVLDPDGNAVTIHKCHPETKS
jgi:predicted enzyme related to lactoylglutathione lyase